MTCEWCDAGNLRLNDGHWSTDQRGLTFLGPCTADPEDGPGIPRCDFRERVAAWRERMGIKPLEVVKPWSEPEREDTDADAKEG